MSALGRAGRCEVWGGTPRLGASAGAALHELGVGIFLESPEEPPKDAGHSLAWQGLWAARRHQEPSARRPRAGAHDARQGPAPRPRASQKPPEVVGGSGLGEPSSGTWGVVLSPYQIDSEEAEGEGDTRCHPGLATGHL